MVVVLVVCPRHFRLQDVFVSKYVVQWKNLWCR